MLWLATTILVLIPQVYTGGRTLILPGRSAPPQQDPGAPVRDGLQQRFQETVRGLRRSVHLAKHKEQAILLQLAEDYDAVADRAVKLARQAPPDLMYGVMRVLATYGGREHAEEIRFLLLTRKFGKATRIAVETMHTLAREEGKQSLFDCLVSANSALRKHAAALLRTRLSPDDGPRLIEIAEQQPRIKIRALNLLGEVATEAARRYLLESLSSKPRYAEQACRGLIAQGEAVVPDLQAILSKAARGRAFAYAAFALVRIGEMVARDLFTDEMREHLIAELDMPDRFVNSVASIALANMAWNSSDGSGKRYRDGMIIDRLVRVVAPTEYIAHLSMLQPCAQRQLTRFSGKDYHHRKDLWRSWALAVAGTSYVGNRRRLDLAEADADQAVLTWEGRRQVMRFHGPAVYDLEKLEHSQDYVLSGGEILDLLANLAEAGFMAEAQSASSTVDSRSLQLSVGSASCRTEPAVDPVILNSIAATLHRCASDQRWQIYRNPDLQVDPVEYWRVEERWISEHPDDQARNRRLKQHILGVLPTLNHERYRLAVQHLASLPDLEILLEASDGDAFLLALRSRPELDELAFDLMDLSLLVPADDLWPSLLALAEERFETGGRQAMARIFALLGPDRILESLRNGSKLVRIAVMDELAQLRDARAIPDLLTLVDSADADLRSSAVYVLGRLQARAGRQPLLTLLERDDQQMDPALRRITWVALARIGGDEVLPVLQSASVFTDPADRRSVIQALGALDHPSAARELARMYARWGDNSYGQLAMQNLRMKGDLVASPILRDMMVTGNQRIRRQIVVLLAEFQDQAALPELFNMLTENPHHLQEIALIAGITGQDATERNDRIGYLRAWYRANFSLPQAGWFLDALGQYGIEHRLELEQLRGNGDLTAVPELTRLLVEAPVPHLRSLAARILRIITQEDYGVVGIHTDEARRRSIAERYLYLVDEEEGRK